AAGARRGSPGARRAGAERRLSRPLGQDRRHPTAGVPPRRHRGGRARVRAAATAAAGGGGGARPALACRTPAGVAAETTACVGRIELPCACCSPPSCAPPL